MSWTESPELTLRIIWNMRSIHEGHKNKPGFYHAFGWLYKNHPRTAVENLRFVVERLCERKIKLKPKPKKPDDGEFEVVYAEDDAEGEATEKIIKMPHGYYKDLLNIVVLAMRNQLTDPALDPSESLKIPRLVRKTRTKKEWKSIKATKKKQNKELGEEEAKKRRGAESEKAASAQAEKPKRRGRQSAGPTLRYLRRSWSMTSRSWRYMLLLPRFLPTSLRTMLVCVVV